MSVPNTSTFRFSDVCNEIYGSVPAGASLVQAFIDATGAFDPAYSGVKDRLSNFRNYNHSAGSIVLNIHFISVNTNTQKLNYDFVIVNNSANNYSVEVRLRNSSQGPNWFTVHSATSYANTTDPVSGLTAPMGVTNTIGDSFELEFSLDGGATWSGTVYAEFPLTLNYDWTL